MSIPSSNFSRIFRTPITSSTSYTAIRYEHKELMKFCEKIIMRVTEILGSAGFLECEKSTLHFILKMDIVSCHGINMFEACMQWVKQKSEQATQRKLLKRIWVNASTTFDLRR